jgi:Trk K+ transport system NAD-binding subunit
MNETHQAPRDDPDSPAPNVLVIGGDDFGFAVAEYLDEGAQSVTVVSEHQPTAPPDDVEVISRELSDATDVRSLAAEVTGTDLVVVVGSDSEALLLGYLVRSELDPCDVVSGLSNPENELAFEGTGVDCIDVPRLLAKRIHDRYN